jgi:hypothetical protein
MRWGGATARRWRRSSTRIRPLPGRKGPLFCILRKADAQSNAGCDASDNGTVPHLINPSFEYTYGLEHWRTTPLSDGIVSVVTESSYPDNYGQGPASHSVILTPIEGPGYNSGENSVTSAAISQRLRVCPGKLYQLVFQFLWTGAENSTVEAGTECELYFSLTEDNRSSSPWADLNPNSGSWTQVTITSSTPADARWVYLTLGVNCPATGALVGTANIDSLNLTLAEPSA